MRQSGLHIVLFLSALFVVVGFAFALPEKSFCAEAPSASLPGNATQALPAASLQNSQGIDSTPAGVPGRAVPPAPALPPSEPYPLLPVPEISWLSLGKGLEVGTASIYESKVRQRDALFVFLRISPEENGFALGMASHAGKPQSLADWSKLHGFRAGINASMYLPDNITSTGYMRDNGRVNNAKLGNKLGAFFLAGRRAKHIPPATVVEKEKNGWRELIDSYDLVVQNYRLISSAGRILWPVGGPEHSIAAVSVDNKGRVLFILCQEPLTSVRFAFYLRSFSLGLGTVLYVEGGAQAGIFVRLDSADKHRVLPGASPIAVDGGTVYVWKGRQNLLNLKGNPHAALPNIIGVTRLPKL